MYTYVKLYKLTPVECKYANVQDGEKNSQKTRKAEDVQRSVSKLESEL